MIGSQAKPRKLCEKYITVFSISVRHQSDKVEPMSIVVDRGNWEVSHVEGHDSISKQVSHGSPSTGVVPRSSDRIDPAIVGIYSTCNKLACSSVQQ